jgi:hypothetical protein
MRFAYPEMVNLRVEPVQAHRAAPNGISMMSMPSHDPLDGVL